MGEPGAACLLRSFSHPSDASREFREGDPIRCLTESISFGRFISESLAWEKWSTFSHNRYLEEVEKFSKPGSVAEKRAFFEAHYKKKAAAKVAASQLMEASSATGVVQESENAHIARDSTSIDLDSAKVNNQVASYEERAVNNQVASYEERAEAKAAASQSEEVSTEIVRESENTNLAQKASCIDLDPSEANNLVQSDEQPEEGMPDAGVESSGDAGVSELNNTEDTSETVMKEMEESSSQSEEVSTEIVRESENTDLAQKASCIDLDASEANNLVQSDEQPEEGMPDAGVSELNNTEDTSETVMKEMEESSKQNSDENISQCEVISLSHSENLKNHVEKTTSQSKEMSVKDTVEERISTLADKKKPEASTSKLSIQKRFSKFPFCRAKEMASLPSRNGKYANPTIDKSTVSTADKKRLTAKSLHMSINFASMEGNTNKTVPLIKKTEERKLPPKLRKDFSVQHKSSKTATNLDSKHASEIQKAYIKRSQALSNSISGGLLAAKSEIKSSNALGSKTQYPIVCSPFRFRSEERAVKRKEKLEEKINAKEEEKLQLHEKFKRKEEQNIRKSQHVFGFKTKVNTESSRLVQSSSNLGKASHMRSHSPRSSKKIVSRTDQETRSKPPRQTSLNVNTESLKYIKGKGNRMMTNSITSLPAGNVHENASPNIHAHNERRKAV